MGFDVSQACMSSFYSSKIGKDAVDASLNVDGGPCDRRRTVQLPATGKNHAHPSVAAVVRRGSAALSVALLGRTPVPTK